MNTYHLKTNAKCKGCTAKISEVLRETPAAGSWEFDLMNPHKILTINTDLPVEDIIRLVNKAGYQAEELKS